MFFIPVRKNRDLLKTPPFTQSSAVAEGYAGQASSGSNSNPRNTQEVFLAVPMKIGRVSILAFLDIEKN
jgi:hypothetical protein